MKKLILVLSTFIIAVNSGLAEEAARPRRIIPIGSLEVLGSYSDIDTGSDLWGYYVSGAFSPVARLNDTQHLIPLYNGTIKRMRQYVAQEEGGRLYNTWQIHNGSLALRTKMSNEWTSRITGIATWNFVKETRDESFGDGLYDYRDFGGSLDLRHTTSPDEKRQYNQTIGLQYFRREYPNYKSLISLATQTATEENEKDFDGVKLSAGLEKNARQALNWEIKPSLLLKWFVDKRLISQGGILNMDKKRKDYVVSVAINGMQPFREGRWELAVDNSLDYNHSNLGFYDSRDTANTNDDVFTEQYYTYLSALTYPSITYYHPFGKDKRISVRAGYSFLVRAYPDRKAQDGDGTYTSKDQTDTEHGLHLKTTFPITKNWDLVTMFDYTIADSNQNYEKYYTYDYKVYQVQSGIALSF